MTETAEPQPTEIESTVLSTAVVYNLKTNATIEMHERQVNPSQAEMKVVYLEEQTLLLVTIRGWVIKKNGKPGKSFLSNQWVVGESGDVAAEIEQLPVFVASLVIHFLESEKQQ
jgi:hypothetical protein